MPACMRFCVKVVTPDEWSNARLKSSDSSAGSMKRAIMPRRTSASIARKAQAKAEADFATWLMMAKLGGFDDLPADAQSWLMNYRGRLEKMSEADATSATTQEVYAQYYADMGGEGDPPEMASIAEPAKNNIVDLKNARVARTSRAADSSAPARPKRALSPFLIFAGMVAILAVIKFAFG